jgi:hypothetical protein
VTETKVRPIVGPSVRSKTGKYKPDFFCLTASLEAVIAESKGAMGPPSAVSVKERKKAKQQVSNVEPVGVTLRPTLNRLTFSTTLRLASDNAQRDADSTVVIEDPDGLPDSLRVAVTADEIVVHSYAKALQFVGLGVLASAMRAGLRPLLVGREEEGVVTIGNERVLIIGQSAGLDVGLHEPTARALLAEPQEGVAQRVRDSLARSDLLGPRDTPERAHRGALILPNGLVFGRLRE